jgi:ABC-2 type transport system permease protein
VSALTRNQVIAFIVAATLCFLLVMSGLELVLGFFRSWAPSFIVDAIASMSFLNHFELISRGVITLPSLFFYFSIIVFFLFANAVVVEQRKAA